MRTPGVKLEPVEGGHFLFLCPGCRESHIVRVRSEGSGHGWTWNGDVVKPTFSPSILLTGLETVRDEKGRWTGEWVKDAAGQPVPLVCHSFITDGRIQFLGDCTHALAGQTVDLPDWSDDE
ncbi:DUF6527 family protein [Pleomorphomonas oryzae]|uniref:DUF6527 family protein n=1 Tax=Pleomorphomonas oryzae TaxID=261934 RepID=UPI00047A6671|nr:DUF6527 family protein [Pleomorphomonas oryzae]